MSSGTKKKNDKPKNASKKKKPETGLEAIEQRVQSEIESLSEFHPETVKRDNQILKAILKPSQEPVIQLQPSEPSGTQNITKKFNLKIKSRESRGTRRIKVKPVDKEEPVVNETIDVLNTITIYGVELRFEKVANKDKMILLTENGSDDSPYKQKY